MRAIALGIVLLTACTDHGESPVARETFDRDVFPILLQSCSANTGGCHGASAGNAYMIDDPDRTYQQTIIFAGDFLENVPLLEKHTSWGLLSPNTRAVIEAWLAEERRERGLF